ncbi:ABC transporter ATP-binding protein [Hymenobacter cellulosivorans]|uniref:ABC transporter ATP-binding protein/permease n=1 Tax=Hymenobacter cellulosivorans TaxID=2932249 RepID=A0ABY4FGS3_9BACT|nr:ABC transporter ATP-binding protein [Hymenobacter cellulosivorans]UOQ55169.1 ABC transporter ATP-binding protein/permease [Hymenobacter cellulosivorans]
MSSILYYLTAAERRKVVWMFFLLILASLLDVVGLAALVPVMMVAAEPGGIHKNKYFDWLFQALNFESERSFLLVLIVAILVFFLLKNAFSVWINHLQTKFTAEVGLAIVRTQLDKYLNFPFWHFNDLGSASLINSSLQVPSTYVNMIIRPLFIFFAELTVVLVIVVGILVYQPLLLVILVFVLLPTTFLTYRSMRARSQIIGNRINELNPISISTITDLFTGFVELRLADKQTRFRNKLLDSQKEIRKLDAEAYLYTLLPLRIIEMVAIFGVLTIFMYALFVADESTSLITLVGLFAAAAYRLMPSVNRMLMSMVQLKQSQYTIENLESFREEEYDQKLSPNQQPLEFHESIAFQNVSFTFPNGEAPVLRGISLKVKKGEKIGFIGSSGSGKTTLMNILLRFYTEQQGHILVDGRPLTPQHLKAWHSIIGYVKQDTFLMQASIRDNITLGDPQVDEDRLHYAIEQASLQGFVQNLPDGLDTFIGERGSKLSGGQRQRIGIARALYKRTEILVLDEATSALDNETEREVNEAINKLSKTEITILIIAHRITTLRECDRIYELGQGEIVAQHQYAELAQSIV